MRRLLLSLVVVLGFVGVSLLASPVYAVDGDCASNPTAPECPCGMAPNSAVCKDLKDSQDESDAAFNNITRNIINVALFVLGIVAIIMIIISGIRWTTSRGDPNSVTKARQILMYSIVGLVIAASAFAIFNFVMSKV
jgi:hypothetical protein